MKKELIGIEAFFSHVLVSSDPTLISTVSYIYFILSEITLNTTRKITMIRAKCFNNYLIMFNIFF